MVKAVVREYAPDSSVHSNDQVLMLMMQEEGQFVAKEL